MSKEMQERLDRVEQKLDKLAHKNFEYTVNIEHLHAHQPVLERLTFRLDQLDVQTVSGALNLGNNFGVRVVQDEKKQTEFKNRAEDNHTTGDSFHMDQTADGYCFKFKRSSP
ncbi:hypothetical protein JOD24_002074 [Kroppenstedtia sanguinis]|uniref:Uncharacterized protein n=1 Tax=Kroppenstedtia sanguinis TaxID=1380684 RepID=A0ABW4C571_9BACL